MNWFITIWLSTAGLAAPATSYNTAVDSVRDFNSGLTFATVRASTATTGQELESFICLTDDSIQTRTFKAREQTLLLDDQGNLIFLGTKFLAPDVWVILGKSVENDFYASRGEIRDEIIPYYDPSEHFTISTDSVKLVNYTVKKAKSTGLGYRIYRGPEFIGKDRYDFKFTQAK